MGALDGKIAIITQPSRPDTWGAFARLTPADRGGAGDTGRCGNRGAVLAVRGDRDPVMRSVTQGAHEVGEEVVEGLEANREAQECGIHFEGRADDGGVRHPAGVFDQ